MGFKSIDCFTLPISQCLRGSDGSFSIVPYEYEGSYAVLYNYSESDPDLVNPNPDICTMGAMFSKPTIWVLGQLFFYHLRPSPRIRKEVQSRVDEALVLKSASKEPERVLSLAMHIRSGFEHLEASNN